MFKSRLSNFFYLLLMLLCIISFPSFAQGPICESNDRTLTNCQSVVAGYNTNPSQYGYCKDSVTLPGLYNACRLSRCQSPYENDPANPEECLCPSGMVSNTSLSGGSWVRTCVTDGGGENPQCEAGPAGSHEFAPDGYLACVGSCQVIQVGDSSCTGTAGEGGVCTASFDYTGLECPGDGDGNGGGSASSASSDSGGGSSGGQASSSGGGDGGDDGGDNGGGDSSSGSGSSGGSASSSGNGNGGTCPEGQISQGTLNGNAICVGQCPTGQYWGGVNGVYGCYGTGGSSAGSGSSDGTGECDPNSKDYAKCIGQLNDVDEGLSDQIIGDATGEAEDKMNEAYDSLTEDIENFSGIDNEFANSPNQLMSALQGFLPSPGACPNIPLTFMGQTASLDCNLFNDFKLAFGWFLSILTAVYIWSLATKPVER